MNDEINKEEAAITEGGKKKKSKISMFDVLAIYLVVVSVYSFYLIFSTSGLDNGWGIFLFFLYLLYSVIAGTVIISLIYGITSIVTIVKDKKSLMPPEKSKRNISLIIDVFFFVFLPIVSYLLYALDWQYIIYSFYISFVIVVAAGIKLIIKNKEGSGWRRASGWFLTIIGITILSIPLFSFLKL